MRSIFGLALFVIAGCFGGCTSTTESRGVDEAKDAGGPHEFACQDLARVEQAMVLIAPAVDDLHAGAYDRLLNRGNPLASFPEEWQRIKPVLVAVDPKYGPVKAFSLQGFEMMLRNLADGTHQLVRLVRI